MQVTIRLWSIETVGKDAQPNPTLSPIGESPMAEFFLKPYVRLFIMQKK